MTKYVLHTHCERSMYETDIRLHAACVFLFLAYGYRPGMCRAPVFVFRMLTLITPVNQTATLTLLAARPSHENTTL